MTNHTRVCRKCKQEKPLTEEFFQKEKFGFNSQCRVCRSEYFKNWRDKKDPEYLRRKAMKELYNTTIEWYETKLKEQNNRCALCGSTQESHRKRMGVDHDHSCCPKRGCGKCNRGILCPTCNYRIGQIEFVLESATIVPQKGTWMEKALAYINHYKVSTK